MSRSVQPGFHLSQQHGDVWGADNWAAALVAPATIMAAARSINPAKVMYRFIDMMIYRGAS